MYTYRLRSKYRRRCGTTGVVWKNKVQEPKVQVASQTLTEHHISLVCGASDVAKWRN